MSKYSRRPSPGQAPAPAAHEADDAFVSHVVELTAWAQRHSQTLVFVAIILALGVAGTVYYFNFRDTLEDQGVAELEQIQQTLGIVSNEESLAELNRFLERFGSASTAGEARLLLGQVHLENANPQGAIDALQPVVGGLGRVPLAAQAAFLLGAAYEEQQRWDDAVAMYLDIADEADLGFQIRGALSDAARVQATLGQYAEAAILLEDLLTEMELDDPGRGVIEMRLAEMRTRS